MLGKLLEEFMDKHDNQKVEKSVPIKKEWKPLLEKYNEAKKESIKAERKKNHAKSAFWSMIEEDLDAYEKPMRLNKDDSEIEIYEEN